MVSLKAMTREMCHGFYKEFQNDPAIGHYYEYVYSPEVADRYFDANTVPDRKLFAILVGDRIVGECKLKNIDLAKRECSMGIHLQKDAVKNKGYGTQAERLVLKYAFEELGMVAVNADAALGNTRSQHVLEKVGFRYTHEDDTFKYYRCEANDQARIGKLQGFMGKRVHVVVDRPVGYQHGTIVYPINYGYIPGIPGGDGEEQDAYILGVHEPLTQFDGQVVAAIRRRNDCEDKLVVAPAGSVYHQGEIAAAVRFQEQFFDSRILSAMKSPAVCCLIGSRTGKRNTCWCLKAIRNAGVCPKGTWKQGKQKRKPPCGSFWRKPDLLLDWIRTKPHPSHIRSAHMPTRKCCFSWGRSRVSLKPGKGRSRPADGSPQRN